MARRNQSATETDAPQDVRARVEEQIEDLTDSQESPAEEAEEEQEDSPPMHSSHASAHNEQETALARETRRALELMHKNISLLFDKHEAQAAKLDETREGLTAITQELRVTAELMQQVIGRHDEQTENLGMQTAALAQAEMQLRQLHQTLREHLSKHQHD
ncbi:MAG: hypothetical protein ACXWPI_15865 [Ktedonobacterales bacterium]